MILNDVTFNPVTGAQTPPGTWTISSFQSIVNNNFSAARINGATSRFVPSISALNNQGSVASVCFQGQPNISFQNPTCLLTQASLTTLPGYDLSSLNGFSRSLSIMPQDMDD